MEVLWCDDKGKSPKCDMSVGFVGQVGSLPAEPAAVPLCEAGFPSRVRAASCHRAGRHSALPGRLKRLGHRVRRPPPLAWLACRALAVCRRVWRRTLRPPGSPVPLPLRLACRSRTSRPRPAFVDHALSRAGRPYRLGPLRSRDDGGEPPTCDFRSPRTGSTSSPPAHSPVRVAYLVDPASSHMLVSKIKPCMSKYVPPYTAKLRMAH